MDQRLVPVELIEPEELGNSLYRLTNNGNIQRMLGTRNFLGPIARYGSDMHRACLNAERLKQANKKRKN